MVSKLWCQRWNRPVVPAFDCLHQDADSAPERIAAGLACCPDTACRVPVRPACLCGTCAALVGNTHAFSCTIQCIMLHVPHLRGYCCHVLNQRVT